MGRHRLFRWNLVRRPTFALLLVAAALVAGKVAVGRRLSAGAVAPYDVRYIPTARVARWASFGHPILVADLYWLRAVQYMGEPRADARGWDKLFPILDLVTDLDPRHGYAYQVGGNILAASGRMDESNRLLEKGVLNVPDRYILAFHRAVNAFLYEGDYALAGEWFERAAQAPGAPRHMREAVMAMYVKGNRAEAAIRFLHHMIEVSEDPESRKALEAQLLQARLEQAALPIDEAAQAYLGRFGHLPDSVRELHRAGMLAEVPRDPFGGSWRLDDEGRAHSTVNDRRLFRPLDIAGRTVTIDRLRSHLRGASSR
jgi:tetratricopeptide (TPR) repeat protein